MVPALDELLQRRDGIAADRHTLDVERELLLGETPGGVVVLERDLRAGDAEILRLDIEPRQRNRPLHLLLEIADRHLGDPGGAGATGASGACREGDSVCAGAASGGVGETAMTPSKAIENRQLRPGSFPMQFRPKWAGRVRILHPPDSIQDQTWGAGAPTTRASCKFRPKPTGLLQQQTTNQRASSRQILLQV